MRSISGFCWPPSISMIVPFTNCISGEARIVTRLATSSTSAMRPSGIDAAAGRRACVIDHDVHAAQCLMAFVDEVLGIGVLGEIRRNGHDLAAALFGDFGRGGVQLVLAARADRNVDALARQRAGDALADAF